MNKSINKRFCEFENILPRKSIRKKVVVLSSYIFFSATFSSSLFGQGIPKDTTTLLQEVIITALLRESFEVNVGGFESKDIMDVPLTIQTFGAKNIRGISAITVHDILMSDPSVQSSSYGVGFDNFCLLGFAMDNITTLRLGGLTLASHYDVTLELMDRRGAFSPGQYLYKSETKFNYGLNEHNHNTRISIAENDLTDSKARNLL
ncbi:hypothetical protein KO02_21950 [Sphingobacterium sp. ML3W]|uniref:hypothetical protein n=1 Tax=Sphingobacterium sp. ML3W TaxID=1538644 RepID=UPI0004F92705|nr:hypothetical protein [Sphingobacterium sp. ML3W]AIM39050.1 hypothetical protein KO02_21950 [Sphingobacterium sp. ML3W]